MLDRSSFDGRISHEPNLASGSQGQSLTLSRLIEAVRRRKLIVIAGPVLGLALAIAYLSVVPSRYLATAQLLMDTKRADQPAAAYANVDQSVIESQVEIIRSQRIALGVIDKLGLASDSEFNRRGLVTRFFTAIGLESDAPKTEGEQLRNTVNVFRNQLVVSRLGPSYVANVAFLSLDRDKAARIANEVVDTYIEDQLSARVLSLERSNSWIQRRTTELRQQAEKAAIALETFKAESIGGSSAHAHRAELERLSTFAQASKRSYDTFQNLLRYVQGSGERMFPATDARILAQASSPLTPSYPNRTLVLFLMLAAGTVLGILAAFICERVDNRVRSVGQLEAKLGVKTLGFLPFLATQAAAASSTGARLPSLCNPEVESTTPLSDLSISVQLAVDAAETARSQANVIGVTSARAGEGKSTIALNLAMCAASSGQRVLLVDCNLRNALLTEVLAPRHRRGAGDASDEVPAPHQGGGAGDARNETAALKGAVIRHACNVDFLPAQSWNGHPGHRLRSATLRTWLETAGQQYDYVVVDLPSILDHVDVHACAGLLGSILLVADFGRTRIEDLQRVWEDETIASRILGVVITSTSHTSRYGMLIGGVRRLSRVQWWRLPRFVGIRKELETRSFGLVRWRHLPRP
jgi:polysaccharide biosynthesis transport protein